MYRQLLDMAQFDSRQGHLVGPTHLLTHKTLLTILSSVGLEEKDPRVKTLTGCFTLLKFTEKSFHHSYVNLPHILQAHGLAASQTFHGDDKMPKK